MKAYRVVKPTSNLEKLWHGELDGWVGEILHDYDLGWDYHICGSDNWFYIRTGDHADTESEHVIMPIVIHKSCLKEIKLCTCNKYEVLNNGCKCGGE